MPPDTPHSDVRGVLDQLRQQCGDSEFGYRIQGLFAHVLIRLGFIITEVKTQGHPDVVAVNGDRVLRVQIKSVKHGSALTQFEFDASDCAGIAGRGAEGVLALLDCAEPVQWIIVPWERGRHLVGRPVHLATLRGDRNPQFSDECSEEFVALVRRCSGQLPLLPYGVLRDRALSGTAL